LTDAQVTLLSDRRKTRPYGLRGGEAGRAGRAVLVTKEGSRELGSKQSIHASAGDRIRIETPGGGGYGRQKAKGKNQKAKG
jgi:N-methylhydantoinase B